MTIYPGIASRRGERQGEPTNAILSGFNRHEMKRKTSHNERAGYEESVTQEDVLFIADHPDISEIFMQMKFQFRSPPSHYPEHDLNEVATARSLNMGINVLLAECPTSMVDLGEALRVVVGDDDVVYMQNSSGYEVNFVVHGIVSHALLPDEHAMRR